MYVFLNDSLYIQLNAANSFVITFNTIFNWKGFCEFTEIFILTVFTYIYIRMSLWDYPELTTIWCYVSTRD